MFGPVSLSNSYPQVAKDFIVSFYKLYYADKEHLARSFTPYQVNTEHSDIISAMFSGDNYEEDFRILKEQLSHFGASVPTLFKQYSELCDTGGSSLLRLWCRCRLWLLCGRFGPSRPKYSQRSEKQTLPRSQRWHSTIISYHESWWCSTIVTTVSMMTM